MKKYQVIIKLFLILVIGFSIFSCVPQKKIKYLQAKVEHDSVHEYANVVPDYKLQAGDYLYIRVLTLDEKSNQVFSNITGSQYQYGGQQGDVSTYLTSYMIDKEGNVTFPIIGTVSAAGLTVKEVEKKLGDIVGEIMKEASVVVKLVHFNVSVIGEVQHPGRFPVYSDRINIFEALAMAGDLSTFSNRNKVQIIRNQNEKNSVVTFDLTKKEILSSPYYYLQPNDIIYVEPLKNKVYAFETFPYSLFFSTITTLLVIATYFK